MLCERNHTQGRKGEYTAHEAVVMEAYRQPEVMEASMTILPHTLLKKFHYRVPESVRAFELIDSAASKAMQMHAEEI